MPPMESIFHDISNNIQIITVCLLVIKLFNFSKSCVIDLDATPVLTSSIRFSASKIWGYTGICMQTVLKIPKHFYNLTAVINY